MRISDWSSDVCSSDLLPLHPAARGIGLYDPRRLSDGRADGEGRAVGARFNPAAVQLRLRGARNHGDAIHPRSEGPAANAPDCAADDLFGAIAEIGREQV